MKRIINNILFFFIAITMMAQGQNSFVVADKKGNSQLVPHLIFQPQQETGSYSWNSNGSATGDIKDLLFVARTKTELATASSEDIIQILEELSGADLVDAEAVAATLNRNENVEEATSEDGANVVLKMKGSNSHVAYPLYDDASIFSEDALQETYTNTMRAIKNGHHTGTTYRGKVAIFNHFQGMRNYSNQNRIVSYIKVMFELNGYDVEYYGKYADPEHLGNIDYDQKFDAHNLSEVIRHSDEYKAILIFSHGFEFGGKSYFATSEVAEKETEFTIYHNLDKENGIYYAALPVEGLATDNKCITYLGSCSGVPKSGYDGNDSFLNKKGSCFLAWNGKNRVAQADAMMLFYDMIYEGLSLKDAVLFGYKKDPWNIGSERLSYNVANHELEGEESLKPNYVKGNTLFLKNIEEFYLKTEYETLWELTGEALGTWKWPTFVKIRLEPMMAANPGLASEEFYGPFGEGRFVSHITFGNNLEENIYRVSAYSLENGNWQPVRFVNPYFFFYSKNLSDNYALPQSSEEDMRVPSILGTEGQPMEEITIPAGSSQTYQLDAYPGHTVETLCLDTDVATVSLNGNSLTVTGVSEGTTYFGVNDKQNHQLAVVKVTVTKGGDMTSYLACPDDHHPHLIDLGLPSGTKWACCNVGATSPEGYGGYYAWGETEEKDKYGDKNYQYYQDYEYISLGNDISGTQYDVAHIQWGGDWCMPSVDQIKELLDNCTKTWTKKDDVRGMLFKGKNDGSIFLPAAGIREDSALYYRGSYGCYRSSTQTTKYSGCAYFLDFNKSNADWDNYDWSREYGLSVRPVMK